MLFSLPMITFKPAIIIIHSISWLLFISLILGFIVSGPENNRAQNLLFYYLFIFIGTYVFLFYFNGYFLIPEFYLRKKYTLYFISIFILFIIVYYLKPFDQLITSKNMHQEIFSPPSKRYAPPPGRYGEPPPRRPFDPPGPERPFNPPNGGRPKIDIVSIILFLMVGSVSTALQIVKQWRTTEHRAIQAEADKATTELSFLRAQINPHFLFNTLNNIYSLVVTKNDSAPDAIMKLSHIMRYVTDEVTQDYVPLEWEVECINHYIDLQRMRLNEKTQVYFITGGDMEGKQIPPLILMTFIENVFKYGISSHEPTTIVIKLMTDTGAIEFFCQNKIFHKQQDVVRKGIGIENIKKRLNQLYPDKHRLNINVSNDLFTVTLILQTSRI